MPASRYVSVTLSYAECDKSFTRSDALAKHMRVQHNTPPVGANQAARLTNSSAADADESRDGDETAEFESGERGPESGVSVAMLALRAAEDSRAVLATQEVRDYELVSARAAALPGAPKRRADVLDDEVVDMDMDKHYYVQKIRLQSAMETREQWMQQLEALQAEERAIAENCRDTLDQLLQRTLGCVAFTSLTQG